MKKRNQKDEISHLIRCRQWLMKEAIWIEHRLEQQGVQDADAWIKAYERTRYTVGERFIRWSLSIVENQVYHFVGFLLTKLQRFQINRKK